MNTCCVRLYAGIAVALSLLLFGASPAHAQFKPRPLNDPATGERFHIEAGVAWWSPSTDMSIASAGTGALAGIPGSQIDAVQDLGFTDQRFPEFQVMLRPAAAHKLRFNYIPISFNAQNTVQRDIIFNGQRYSVGIPLTSTLDWKAYRFGYEYDFIRKNRGFGGFITEVKYTDVNVELDSNSLQEFAHARAPVPAIGGIARYYIVPNIAVTGEVTGFKIPTIQDRYAAHYVDIDIYGTVNMTNNVGVQAGWRSMDLGYLVKQDTGSFTLRGLYFGVVARY